jgi:hypothetical protein
MRYYKSPEITTKNHFLVDTIWPVKGSKGNTYSVKMHEKGFTCECLGFSYNGKCKHTTQVTSLLINENYPRYELR